MEKIKPETRILRGSNYCLTRIYRGITVFEKELMVHNDPNIDLVSDNECTRFGKMLSIHSYNMEQKPKSYVNQGP